MSGLWDAWEQSNKWELNEYVLCTYYDYQIYDIMRNSYVK